MTSPAAPAATMRSVGSDPDRTVTCQFDIRNALEYEVCVLPHCEPSSALIESYDDPAPALLRQAELVKRLRENGWTVIARLGATSQRDVA